MHGLSSTTTATRTARISRTASPLAKATTLLLAATLLAGCGAFQRKCHEPQPYEAAGSVPPLRAPEGLDAPNTRNALRIPDVERPAPRRGPGDPCLDEPPSFFPGRPRPGQAPTPAAAPAAPAASTAAPAATE